MKLKSTKEVLQRKIIAVAPTNYDVRKARKIHRLTPLWLASQYPQVDWKFGKTKHKSQYLTVKSLKRQRRKAIGQVITRFEGVMAERKPYKVFFPDVPA